MQFTPSHSLVFSSISILFSHLHHSLINAIYLRSLPPNRRISQGSSLHVTLQHTNSALKLLDTHKDTANFPLCLVKPNHMKMYGKWRYKSTHYEHQHEVLENGALMALSLRSRRNHQKGSHGGCVGANPKGQSIDPVGNPTLNPHLYQSLY
jgi:hypothetical protein